MVNQARFGCALWLCTYATPSMWAALNWFWVLTGSTNLVHTPGRREYMLKHRVVSNSHQELQAKALKLKLTRSTLSNVSQHWCYASTRVFYTCQS